MKLTFSPLWLWPAVLATTIVFASGHGQVAAPNIVDFDKMAHFSIFGLLGSLVARTPAGRRWWWLGIVAASLFGASDEFHQSFTPGRSVDAFDWLADTSGAVVAVCVYRFWNGYRRLMEWRFGSKPPVEKSAKIPPDCVAS